MTTTTTTNVQIEEQVPPPTFYTIRWKETFETSRKLWLSAVAVLGLSIYFATLGSETLTKLQDKIDNGIFSGMPVEILVAVVLGIGYTSFRKTCRTKTVDVSLDVLPLGLQRSKTTTLEYDDATHTKSVFYYPLLPLEEIRDCILLEHVGAFNVSTHVMIRRSNDSKQDFQPENASSGMVAAFPGANLTFEECQRLVKQIQRALEEVQP